jgi:hypothetical protein
MLRAYRRITNTNLIVFGLNPLGIAHTIYCTRGEQANHYTPHTVKKVNFVNIRSCLTITRRVPVVHQELITLSPQEHLSSRCVVYISITKGLCTLITHIVRLECSRSCVRSPIGSNKRLLNWYWWFSGTDAALRRKIKNWLTRDQDNVSVLGDMSTRGLFFKWDSTIKIQQGCWSSKSESHHHLIDNYLVFAIA